MVNIRKGLMSFSRSLNSPILGVPNSGPDNWGPLDDPDAAWSSILIGSRLYCNNPWRHFWVKSVGTELLEIFCRAIKAFRACSEQYLKQKPETKSILRMSINKLHNHVQKLMLKTKLLKQKQNRLPPKHLTTLNNFLVI